MRLITIQEMLHELSSGKGISELLAKISVATDLTTVMTTTTGEILASGLLPLPLRQETQVSARQNPTDSQRCILMIKDREYFAYRFLIPGTEAQGYFYIVVPEADLICSETQLIGFGKDVALLLAMELKKQGQIAEVHRQYKETFMFDLFYANIELLEDIVTKGLLWGWNLNQPHAVIVFRLSDYNKHAFLDSHRIKEFLSHIQTVIVNTSEAFDRYENKENLLEYPLMIKNEDILLILPVEGKSKIADNAYIANLIAKILETEHKKLTTDVHVGIGRVYASPLDIFRSYQEAKSALELGRFSSTSVNFFSNLGLAQILYNHDPYELRVFYQETLGELERYDQENGSDLTNTLEKYLELNCDSQATARELFLHRNTLRYRLKKIKEILDVEIEKFETRLDLVAAFKIKYLKRTVNFNSKPK